jgi:hypothetical protein
LPYPGKVLRRNLFQGFRESFCKIIRLLVGLGMVHGFTEIAEINSKSDSHVEIESLERIGITGPAF